ncbi:BTAD domain-containing putative transcriptional regulator [Streptomyces sp. SID14515]|uniref:AfsR/SARP family transcriptional regulator n=1 Tax=Streptomyces sp. SID14515 TaxID=2706074 RepID=UPI0013CCEBF5|nr:BTAD domain-containing putative transcriptional regulator [Streptomyces sp. SID14515]NEB36899.1 tetratricopeptide repeat protein [Streptomyces sp. SID14515]
MGERARTGTLTKPTFQILGALKGWQGEHPLRLGGRLRERTLTMLLLEADRVIPVHRLVAAGWDDEPPSSAAHQVRKAIAELRQNIPYGPETIVTDGPGYRACVTPEQVDLGRYLALLGQAREAKARGESATTADCLHQALELWRGPVLAGEGGPVINGASAALEEQHLGATEQLFELRLDAGKDAEIIGALRTLVQRHPLRETLRRQLMLALYRTGQQAEALEEYGRARTLLAEEFGIDPSAELCGLYERILRQSPDLAPLRHPAAVPPAPAPKEPAETAGPAGTPRTAGTGGRPGTAGTAGRPGTAGHPGYTRSAGPVAVEADEPNTLPYGLQDFSGRATELDWIRDAAERTRGQSAHIVAIDGMGGSGKTALAARAAWQLAEWYPDGQLFIDLRGFTPGQEPLSPSAAHEALLAMAGVSGTELPATAAGRAALWQSVTRRRRLVVVLDNAADSEQVRSLIPSSPHCLTLITSRPRLVDLDAVEWLSLDVLPEQDGIELIKRIVGAGRVDREPDAVIELVRLCGRLPLAIRIAAGRLRNRTNWTVRRLVERLNDDARRLAELSSGGRSVAGVLRLSYDSMPPEQRTGLRLLSLHPGRVIGTEDAAALLGTGTEDAEQLMEALTDAHLLQENRPGWYTLHDLVRSFAGGLSDESTAAEDAAATRRLLDHYVHTAERANATLFPERVPYGDFLPPGRSLHPGFGSRDDALAWLDLHRDDLLAAVEVAHAHGLPRHAATLPRELGFHSDIRNYPRMACTAYRRAVDASRELEDVALLRLNLTNLAMHLWPLGRFRESVACLEEARGLARELRDERAEAACLGGLGQNYNSLGDFPSALRHTEEAARMEARLGLVRGLASSLNILSSVRLRTGRFIEAAEAAEESIKIFEATGETHNSALGLTHLALARTALGNPEEAVQLLTAAQDLCEQVHSPANTAFVLACTADVMTLLNRADAALTLIDRARALVQQADVAVRQAAVMNAAGRVHRALGEPTEALRHHRQARDLSAGIGFRFEEALALDGMAKAHAQAQEPTEAADCRHRADALFEAMGVPEGSRTLF